MTAPLAIFGIDVGDLVEDAVRALVDLVVPDFGSEWVSSLVTWLVALPPLTGSAFPSLNDYARQLTAVGFGVLGACFLAGLLQLWAGGTVGRAGGEAVRHAAVGAGALATYATVLQTVLVGINVLTAQMIRHPLVVDGLDKAFGESLSVAAVTGGVSLGLAIAAALVLLFFVAALFVLKIGLTALLAVAVVAGALVWGLYPLPQAQWLTRAWVSGLVAALAVPVAWACVFAAAALLARDTLVFDGGGQFNAPLGETLGYLVKPFAAVACFWIAYRAPYFLLGVARTAGLSAAVLRGPARRGVGAGSAGAVGSSRAVKSPSDRFRAFFVSSPSTPRSRKRGSGPAVVGNTSGRRAAAATSSGAATAPEARSTRASADGRGPKRTSSATDGPAGGTARRARAAHPERTAGRKKAPTRAPANPAPKPASTADPRRANLPGAPGAIPAERKPRAPRKPRPGAASRPTAMNRPTPTATRHATPPPGTRSAPHRDKPAPQPQRPQPPDDRPPTRRPA